MSLGSLGGGRAALHPAERDVLFVEFLMGQFAGKGVLDWGLVSGRFVRGVLERENIVDDAEEIFHHRACLVVSRELSSVRPDTAVSSARTAAAPPRTGHSTHPNQALGESQKWRGESSPTFPRERQTHAG